MHSRMVVVPQMRATSVPNRRGAQDSTALDVSRLPNSESRCASTRDQSRGGERGPFACTSDRDSGDSSVAD
ncbi:MAG: hypothetical protein DWH97_13120 [Planctomycetota bacterium]|nr:MAG: hypothetical protein DWH97_13120 [Planctomycetota bacterium]